jgi:small subunit ribosomal protein S18
MAGPRQGGGRERREKQEKFQSFNRPKIKATKTAEGGKVFVDYKDTETLRKLVSGNGKLLTRKRTGADAMDQRMIAQAVKRARFMALLPYASTSF